MSGTDFSPAGFDGALSAGDGTSLIVLGHGSRAPEAAVLLNWVASRLTVRFGARVLAASLQFNEPTLDDCCRQLARQGARRIVVAPYFLFTGNHLQRDIPEVISQLRKELAGVEIVMAEPLGADDLLVEVVARRALAHIDGAQDAATNNAASPAAAGDEARAADPMPQHPIEVESFAIIDSLLEPADSGEPEYQVIRRIVHTTGDPSLARAVLFSDRAVAAGVAALASKSLIYCDVKMVAAGVEPTAAGRGLRVACLVGEPGVAGLAGRENITRAAAAVRLAARDLDGAVVAIGNSPTALFELLRLAAGEGIRPALVVGVPVGFVGAAESKEALAASDLTHITIPGNRGGSTVAAAVVNALIRLSAATVTTQE
ncbi:MAG: precorrin-8X methylmutase [Actinobacteria bacterium]|nr:precorrin-8X methylmutase [Actinomycetota bacterium]